VPLGGAQDLFGLATPERPAVVGAEAVMARLRSAGKRIPAPRASPPPVPRGGHQMGSIISGASPFLQSGREPDL
jgi:hypothetical protein